MIPDAQTLLSDAQAITTDAVSTNTYDLKAAGIDVGTGEPMGIGISVDVAADFTTTDETYTFEFIQSASADLSGADILSTRTIAAASLTAGSFHVLTIPPGAVTKRYLGVNYNVGGTTPTVTCTAWIAPLASLTTGKVYPSGFTVS